MWYNCSLVNYIVLEFDINYQKDIPNFVIFISIYIYISKLVSDFAIKMKIIWIYYTDSVERIWNIFYSRSVFNSLRKIYV